MFVGPDYWRNHFPTLEAQDHCNPGRSPLSAGLYGIYQVNPKRKATIRPNMVMTFCSIFWETEVDKTWRGNAHNSINTKITMLQSASILTGMRSPEIGPTNWGFSFVSKWRIYPQMASILMTQYENYVYVYIYIYILLLFQNNKLKFWNHTIWRCQIEMPP